MSTEKLVTIAQYNHGTEAHIARCHLESMEIECYIQDEVLNSVDWLYSIAMGGVKLQVKSSDVEHAKEILEQREEIVQKENHPIESTELCCPQCNSDEIYFEKFARKPALLSWLFLGFPFPFIKRKWRCSNCGYQWKNKRPGNSLS